jgi:hypothetical protein
VTPAWLNRGATSDATTARTTTTISVPINEKAFALYDIIPSAPLPGVPCGTPTWRYQKG